MSRRSPSESSRKRHKPLASSVASSSSHPVITEDLDYSETSLSGTGRHPDQSEHYQRQQRISRKHSIAHLLRSPSPSGSVGSQRPLSRGEMAQHPLDRHQKEEREGSALSDEGSTGSVASVVLSAGSNSDSQGDWVYTLEIIQQPQRARACGFGDKDRRPLSPPPIIRLRVYTSKGELVNPSHVNIQFLILMADLWSADGTHQRNVVMHPGSQLVRAPAFEGPPGTAGSSSSESRSEHGGQYGYPGHFRYNMPGLVGSTSAATTSSPVTESSLEKLQSQSPSASYWDSQRNEGLQTRGETMRLAKPAADYPHQSASQIASSSRPTTASGPLTRLDALKGSPSTPSGSRPATSGLSGSLRPSYQHPDQSTTSRPSSSYNRPQSSHLTLAPISRPSTSGSRTQFSHREPLLSPMLAAGEGHADQSFRPDSSSSHLDRPFTGVSAVSGFSGRPSTSGARPSTASTYPLPTTPTYPRPLHSPIIASYAQFDDPSRLQMATGATANYSRVLVGTLCCVCQRLSDEHGEPGLFFFAHDLGIRTEGSFRLRFTLTSLASMMQNHRPDNTAPVLAEVQSEAFTVYSAKKFPGVIPTTELTRVFARQNVRLPTRQRRQGRARSEGDSEDEDD